MGDRNKMQGRLSAWLVKHGLVHRSLGFDYQGVETLQIKSEDWHSIAVILIEYGMDQPEEVCIKVFVPRGNPRIPSIFWFGKARIFKNGNLMICWELI
ncbi:NAD(P)H-quinone oxidoreductase subunit J chloroplastic [Bienertia sinuspersici]